MRDIEIEQTKKRAKEIASKLLPSWEGGFAIQAYNAIDTLQNENSKLTTMLHNKTCMDDEIKFCKCNENDKPHHTITETIEGCSVCGGAVAGAVLMI